MPVRTLVASLALSALASAPSLFAQAIMVDTSPSNAVPTAIVGGKLLTITHGVIENGTILLEGGKITAIGAAASVKLPKGATIVDAKGMTVYPGLIDAETNLGLTEISSDPMSNDTVETSEEILPQMHVYDAFHGETEHIPIDRLNGITNAIVAPRSSDTMPGQDSFIQLAGINRDQMILKRDVALPMNFGDAQRRNGQGRGEGGGGGGARFPSTRMGEISQLHQALIDATEYMKARAAGANKPAADAEAAPPTGGRGGRGGAPGSKFDLKNEALLPYLRGEKPVIVNVEQGHDVEPIMKLAKEFNLKVVLTHLNHTQDVLDEIASYHVPVIVGSIYELPEAGERFDAVYSIPAELNKRGVKVAMASFNMEFERNLPYAAGYAVAFGLPYEEALKAITINPAEIFGVADKLGSLDVGKTANVVIANGDPLDVRTSVQQVYIDGVAIPMVSRQTRLRDEYMHLTKPTH